ncbi:MAG: NAD(P)-dependent alcohol dehydrogenase [Bacteroidales bacterium]
MKAMMLTAIRRMEMKQVPDPELTSPDDVLIRMSVVGVCGSDIHYYSQGRIGSQVVKFPFTIGHEGSGVVVKTGPEVKNVKPGDTVAIEPAMPCHVCDQCLSGRPHTCRQLRYLGCPGQAEGCLSEYIVMPEECCYPLPENLSSDHGAISEPLSIGLYSVLQSVDMKGKSAAILGFGPIGMSVMLSLRALGATSVYVTDKIDDRLSIARKEGATIAINPLNSDAVSEILRINPLGPDVVFECCGQQEAIDQAVQVLKPGGKLMVVGIPETDRLSFDADNTRRREITVQFVRRQVNCVQPSIELMGSGKIDIGRMITHRFPFERTMEAFELVSGYRDGVMKAMIDF